MTAPATPLERLERALAELGALTPDGIADRMRALGIKGEKTVSCRCVLAVYLAKLGIEGVLVTLDFGPLDSPSWYATLRHGSHLPLPTSVAEFAGRFDDGVYLDLVAVDGGAAGA